MTALAFAATASDAPLAPWRHREPRPPRRRRRDRDPLLRRLPLRHPPGAQRMGRHRPSPGPRPRDRRPRHRRRRRRHPLQARRPRRRRLHRRLLPRLRPTADRGEEHTAATAATAHLQRPRPPRRRPHLRRLLRHASSSREHFVLHIPESLDLAAAAPLLCAGITTYSPLRHWDVGPGNKVGVIGLGGLGHMAVKFADGVRRRRRPSHPHRGKADDAQALGADARASSRTDADAMAEAAAASTSSSTPSPRATTLDPYLALLEHRRHARASSACSSRSIASARCR